MSNDDTKRKCRTDLRAREQAGTGAITVTYTPMHSFTGNNAAERRLQDAIAGDFHSVAVRSPFNIASIDDLAPSQHVSTLINLSI